MKAEPIEDIGKKNCECCEEYALSGCRFCGACYKAYKLGSKEAKDMLGGEIAIQAYKDSEAINKSLLAEIAKYKAEQGQFAVKISTVF